MSSSFAPVRRSASTAELSRRSVINELKRLTTMPKRFPAASSLPSVTLEGLGEGFSIFICLDITSKVGHRTRPCLPISTVLRNFHTSSDWQECEREYSATLENRKAGSASRARPRANYILDIAPAHNVFPWGKEARPEQVLEAIRRQSAHIRRLPAACYRRARSHTTNSCVACFRPQESKVPPLNPACLSRSRLPVSLGIAQLSPARPFSLTQHTRGRLCHPIMFP
jgi:hypothetical protein